MGVEVITREELEVAINQIGDVIREAVGAHTAAPQTQAATYMGRREAAKYLCMGLSKLDELTRRGDIRRAKIGDGDRAQVLYRRVDLDAFVESHLDS